MTNFAKTVSLPFDTTGRTNAPKAPWVLVGGSYSGSLAAWTEITAPGTFWAYHASSAPVQAIENYWEYFQPIQQGMPKACSNDIISVITHVDTVLTTGTEAEKQALKTMFGLGTVVHDADFARTLTLPLDLWQVGISEFMVFCEALEGVPAGQVSPTSSGIGLAAALPNFASYIASTQGCSAPDCYDSYNANQFFYTNTQLDTDVIAGRQWQWMLCNEAFGFWQTGAPAGQDSLVSRVVTADYYQQQCNFYFPGVQFGLTEDAHNAKYMGWDVKGTTRVMFSSGEFDPWRSAGVSSEFRPGGPMVSTFDIPVFIVPGGVHTQDLSMPNITPEIAALQVLEVAQMKRWIGEFYTKANTTSSSVSSTISSTKTSSSGSSTRPTSTSATVTSSLSSSTIASNSTISSMMSSATFVSSSIRSSGQSQGTAPIVTKSSNSSNNHSPQTRAPYNNSTRSYTHISPMPSLLSSSFVVSKIVQPSNSLSISHSVLTTSIVPTAVQSSNILPSPYSLPTAVVTHSIQRIIPSAVSTVYATETYTIISCHPSATGCPATSTWITTHIISISTTVCAVTTFSTSASIQASSVAISTSTLVVAHPISSASQVPSPHTRSIASRAPSSGTLPKTISTRSQFNPSSKSIPLASDTGTISFTHRSRNSSSYNFPTASTPRASGTGSPRPVTTGSPYMGPQGAFPLPEQASHTTVPVQSSPLEFTGAAGRLEITALCLVGLGLLFVFIL